MVVGALHLMWHHQTPSLLSSNYCWSCLTSKPSWVSGQLVVQLIHLFYYSAGCSCLPNSVSILNEFTSFWATLHWPRCAADFRIFGISYLELLLMCEQSARHGLTCEKVIRSHLRARRPQVGSSFPAGIGNEIRRRCQFIHGLFRSLGHLPGG